MEEMVIETFTAFRASDGSVHDSPYAAWQRELRLFLRAHGVDNDAIAATIVKHLDDGRPKTLIDLQVIVTGLIDTAPPAPPKAVEPTPDAASPALPDAFPTTASVVEADAGQGLVPA